MPTHTYIITYTHYYSSAPGKITFAYKTANKGSLLATELVNIAIKENMQDVVKIPADTSFNVDMIFDAGENDD